MKVAIEVKKAFFDRKKVSSAVDKKTRSVLSRFGAYVRTTARQSIRRRKKPSQPPNPPTNRTGLLKDHIYFSYDAKARSVVIGPAKLNGRSSGIGATVPEVLEHGGRSRTGRGKDQRIVTIEARPYMGPAFLNEQAKLPKMWRGQLK